MKRIISFILTLAILMGMSVNFVSAETVDTYSEAEKFAIAIGVVDDETYEPNALVSRAEYAEMIARLCMLKTETDSYEEWYNRVFGEDNKDQDLTHTADNVFADVDQSSPQYEAINIVYSYGYMKGLTESHFGPNYDITFGAVTKVLVHMLGYSPVAERNGGYPGGFLSVAGSMGLTKGMGTAANSFVTFEQCIEMFYRAIDVRMMDLSYVEDDGTGSLEITDETFLTGGLGLYRMEGRVEDNGISSLYGNSHINDSLIKISGITMDVTGCEYARSYLGKNVDVFYKEIDGTYKLIYAFPTKNTEVTISAEDYIGVNGNELEYYDENGKVKSADISGAKAIYNNKAITSYTSAIFNFTHGDITLVSTDNTSECDLIVIRDYMVGRVKKVNAALETIYTETHYNYAPNSIAALDLSDNNKTVMIYDKNGKSITVSEISEGNAISVLMSSDKKCIEVWVSDMSVSDYVISDYSEDSATDSITVSDGETSYTILGKSTFANAPTIKRGIATTLLFDANGNLVWIESGAEDASVMKGIVTGLDIKYKTFENEYKIRLYTEKGQMKIYEIGEKLIINGKSEKTANIENTLNSLKNDNEVILFKLDEEGTTLKSITTPLAFGAVDTDNRGWYYTMPRSALTIQSGETVEQWQTRKTTYGLIYQLNGNMLGSGFMFYDKATTTGFTVPVDPADYDDATKFEIGVTFVADARHFFNAYSTDPDDMTPEVIAMAGNASGGALKTETAFLVKSISDTINDELLPVKVLTGYDMTTTTASFTEKKMYISSSAIFKADNADGSPVNTNTQGYIDSEGPGQLSDLGIGDVIRYSADEKNEIKSLRVVYDADRGNAFTVNGGKGPVAEGIPLLISGDYVRILKDENILPQNFSKLNDMLDSGAPSVTKVVSGYVNPKSVYVAENVNGKYIIRKGSIDDIVTFEDSGVLQSYNKVVVVKHLGMTIGTIIYK